MSQYNISAFGSGFAIQSAGTFTPTLLLGGANSGMTGTFLGSYVKTGLQVDVMIQITLTNKGVSTGNASIGNLPFTTATSTFPKALPMYLQNTTAAGATYTSFAAIAGSNTTTLASLLQYPQSASTALNVTDASLSNTSVITITGTYRSAT